MSQTETLLLFVLGFCAALFVVLLFGRGVWALVGTWSGWREIRRQPAAILELEAERDSLKAEKAMMAQKLEATISDMKMRMAEQMAEVSRNRNRLLDLGQTLKERESTIGHLGTQMDDKSALVSSLNTQIEENVKSINLAYAKMAQREEENVRMQKVLKEAQATLMMRDEKIRNLMDEAKALREIAANYSSPSFRAEVDLGNAQDSHKRTIGQIAPLVVATGSIESFAAQNNLGNPLLQQNFDPSTELFARKPEVSDAQNFSEPDMLDRSVSNVLSLAERVRSLQTGMKKA
jgi:chromosome segregation ATPase